MSREAKKRILVFGEIRPSQSNILQYNNWECKTIQKLVKNCNAPKTENPKPATTKMEAFIPAKRTRT